MWDADAIGSALTIVLSLVVVGWITSVLGRRRRRAVPVRPVEDGDPATPYRVFTREFDLVLPVRAVPDALASDPLLRANGWLSRDPGVWRGEVEAARVLADHIDPDGEQAGRVRAAFARTPERWAIALLIDQSGSMRGEPMHYAAATARWFSDLMVELHVPCAVLGFSTVGWRGGRARERWLWSGSPRRPGRLAALLHVIYQPFGSVMTDEDWTVMLHPDLLCENIDGEAIEWAVSLLADRPEPRRLLVVMSDGAPVDDATLMHNGPSYLWRHLKQIIAEADAKPGLMLARSASTTASLSYTRDFATR